MSQEELAGRVGVSMHTIDAFEQGTRRASAEQLFEIADVLEVQIEGFFSTEVPVEPVTRRPSLPAEAESIAGLYDALSKSHRAAIFAFIAA
jgi:transcriptional regulator with XRE-family HTH domain